MLCFASALEFACRFISPAVPEGGRSWRGRPERRRARRSGKFLATFRWSCQRCRRRRATPMATGGRRPTALASASAAAAQPRKPIWNERSEARSQRARQQRAAAAARIGTRPPSACAQRRLLRGAQTNCSIARPARAIEPTSSQAYKITRRPACNGVRLANIALPPVFERARALPILPATVTWSQAGNARNRLCSDAPGTISASTS